MLGAFSVTAVRENISTGVGVPLEKKQCLPAFCLIQQDKRPLNSIGGKACGSYAKKSRNVSGPCSAIVDW